MLYCARIDVHIPADMPADQLARLREAEKEQAIKLQREGKMVHLWRIAGQMANISVYDCKDNDELHQVLTSLPMFPYFRIEILPLAKHPSSIA